MRENAKVLGNLLKDFNFKQSPRSSLVLAAQPKTDLIPATPAQLAAINNRKGAKKRGNKAICTRKATKILRVTATTDTSITATNSSGAPVTLVTDPNTIYVGAGGPMQTRPAMPAGTDIIVVHGTTSSDGSTITANRIRVLKVHC